MMRSVFIRVLNKIAAEAAPANVWLDRQTNDAGVAPAANSSGDYDFSAKRR